jgi:hypothetical protein
MHRTRHASRSIAEVNIDRLSGRQQMGFVMVYNKPRKKFSDDTQTLGDDLRTSIKKCRKKPNIEFTLKL